MRRSILLVFSLCAACASLFGQQPGRQEPPDTLYRSNSLYRERCEMWALDSMRNATIVMLGNSITQGGAWNTLLSRPDVANRGIGSDNTYGYLHRMRFVTSLHPRVCFVMGGINDLYAGYSVETVVRNTAAILDTLRTYGIIPVVQSTLFASPKWSGALEKNVLVEELNRELRSLCTVRGIPFMDLNARLSEKGVLKDDFTTDGIHLSQAAYSAWAVDILAFLRRHGI